MQEEPKPKAGLTATPYRRRVLNFRQGVGPGRKHGRVLTDSDFGMMMRELFHIRKVSAGAPPVPGASLDAVTRPTLFPSVVTPIDLDRAGPEFVLDSSVRNKWLKELVESR
ncbi:MAG: hypothetical protein WDA37_10055, partial [Dysgonamonadaceae bacterium]